MKFRKSITIPAIAIVLVGLMYYRNQINYPTCTFRYKLTAEVNTPDGVKSGSSVIEVSYAHNGDWGGGDTPNLHMTGEAVYVDLGAGKNLFVLLTNRESGRPEALGDTYGNYEQSKRALDAFALPIKVWGLSWVFGEERKLCKDLAIAGTLGKTSVPLINLPTLVTFGNLDDPNSVEVVQPDKLDASLGSGYNLLDAKLEATTDVPQSKIESVLKWLREMKQKDILWILMYGIHLSTN